MEEYHINFWFLLKRQRYVMIICHKDHKEHIGFVDLCGSTYFIAGAIVSLMQITPKLLNVKINFLLVSLRALRLCVRSVWDATDQTY